MNQFGLRGRFRRWLIRHPHVGAGVITFAVVLLILLTIPVDSCGAQEPFVTKPALRARLLIYGTPTVGFDGMSTLWARSRHGVYETNPWLQNRGVMLAYKAGQALVLTWLDGILPPFWRWVERIGAYALYGWRAWKTVETGRKAGAR